MVQDTTGGNARLDILPGNRLSLTIDTEVSALGLAIRVQVTNLFEIKLVGQSLEVALIDVQAAGFDLPPETLASLGVDVLTINQDLSRILEELSAGLDTTLILTGLGTETSQAGEDAFLWLEARENR